MRRVIDTQRIGHPAGLDRTWRVVLDARAPRAQ